MGKYNNTFLRNRVLIYFNEYFKKLKENYLIQEYFVVCDKYNNLPYLIDRGEFHLYFFIQENNVEKFTELRYISTKDTISLKEID